MPEPPYIPLRESPDAAGGYLVRDGYGGVLFKGLLREGAIPALCAAAGSYRPTTSRREVFTVAGAMPEPSFVGEAVTKPTVGLDFAPWTVNVKKLACIVLYTDELLEDAETDPRILINPRMADQFAHVIDAHALGYHDGTAITSQFDSAFSSVPAIPLGGTPDAIALAVSNAMAAIEAKGYTPTGIAAGSKARASLRNARGPGDNAATPLYTNGFGAEPDTLYGMRIQYTSNLVGVAGATPTAGALVGDFRQCVVVVRHDLTTSVSNEATVGGKSLWTDNLTGVRYEMRVGFNIIDPNAFVQITGVLPGLTDAVEATPAESTSRSSK